MRTPAWLAFSFPLCLLLTACGADVSAPPDDYARELLLPQSVDGACPDGANQPGGALRCATVPRFAEIAVGQRCPNWCWAASAEMLVRSQGVGVSQQDFVRKIYGPQLPCRPSEGFDNIVRAINGTYPRQGGGTVTLGAAYHLGAPTNSAAMIQSIVQGRPFVFAYSGHALVAYGVSWQQSGAAVQPKELLLLDPYFPYGAPKYRRFRVGIDNANGIQGTMELLVR